jgi:hypothetical protein
MGFYIKYQHYQEGPLDLVTVITKIRRGSLEPDMLVFQDGEEPVAAASHPKLQEFFLKTSDATGKQGQQYAGANRSFGELFKLGWRFFLRYQSSSIYTAIIVLAAVAIGLGLYQILPDVLKFIAFLVTWVVATFGLGVLEFAILRLTRGQPAGAGWLVEHVSNNFVPMLTFSAIAGLLSLIGGILILIPGLFVIAIYLYAPLLILERNMDFWEAMEASRRAAFSNGYDSLGILFGFVVINFVAAILIFPLLFTLPITLGAVAELYEEQNFS